MPGMFSRFSTIVKAKMNSAADAAEDPNEMLDYSYEKQMEMLQKVRRGIADVTTAKHRVQGQLTQLTEQTNKLEAQARQALQLGREDLARTALTRKSTIDGQATALAGQVADLDAQQQKLMDGEARLSAKINAFRSQKEVMKAQYSAAQAQVRIGEAASGLSEEMGDVQLAMQRAQDKTETMKARASAIDELAGTDVLPELGPGGDDLDRQLAQLGSGDAVELQLEAMRRSLPGAQPPTPARALPAADAEYQQQPQGYQQQPQGYQQQPQGYQQQPQQQPHPQSGPHTND